MRSAIMPHAALLRRVKSTVAGITCTGHRRRACVLAVVSEKSNASTEGSWGSGPNGAASLQQLMQSGSTSKIHGSTSTDSQALQKA